MDAHEWLASRRPGAPAPLLKEMRRAVDRTEAGYGSLPERLAAAALSTLEAVADGTGRRAAASQLLASDALLTYACEAAAEAGPEALASVTTLLSPARFERLLAPGAGS